MKAFILRYLVENWDDLLKFDMSIARLLGAPAPHTISSYAYMTKSRFVPVIDFLFKWLMNEENHCQRDYERVQRETKPSSGT